jgi:hypothetical protein
MDFPTLHAAGWPFRPTVIGMKRLILILALMVSSLGLIAFSAPAMTPADVARSAPTQRPAVCRPEPAVGMPSWVTSGVEMDGRFLVVDVNNRQLVEISTDGIASNLRSALGSFVAGKNVARILQGGKVGAAPPSIVLEFAGGNLLDIDRALVPRRKTEMMTSGRTTGSDKRIVMLHNWTVTGDGKEAFGYADLSIGDPMTAPIAKRRNGFVRFALDGSKSFQIVDESPFPGDQRTMMRLSYPFVASLGSTAYAINQDGNHLDLRRFGGQGDPAFRHMAVFPEELQDELAPMLPSFVSAEEYVRTMKAAETATMPVGLYAWDDALFILSRTYKEGRRHWALSRIDPKADNGGGALVWTVPVPLPTSARHAMAIPGERQWAFLAKGTVLGVQNQITDQILFVNSKSLRVRDQSLRSLCN